ncbi:ArnT family glycosyltransferase [Leptospira weilii]|uniref:Dolichyl-phosphate-mannose-protein mannosyltransferase n=1 Tax=Leptospira weilii str. UI 13098 TaxID=1088542 RepID=M6QE58_9LEPT|nr:glycosyltransferase family 39 protein [Leptospira weilii]EMN90888.1 dolichyl-phosphate-mannose-protein mannosyltransferase [Leptospira weilii str. UI 13098]OMI16908.1 dolichyl-phosphate-mannose--protein mannosyltransferase [Leptospira weilii serovar Heyan]QDK23823.1 dolichyl-phosphate-mannose--protein mannosyltransferase [Leptospira weilii]QDK26540.1 dolichyl-phosphate-mannose--protein mannosyltransferase [Leptospira weilii]
MKLYLLFLLSCLILFFGFKTDFEVTYGDSGFMWVQVMDLIQSDFRTFSFYYSGSSFDPKGEWLPFQAPFLGIHDLQYYIDFPPYFPLVVSVGRVLFGSNLGIYLIQVLFFSGSIYFLYLLFSEFTRRRWLSVSFVYLYLFGTTVFTYNLVIHEYSIALFFLYGGIYFYHRSIKTKKNTNFIYSSLLFGLSLYFRLEFIFVIFPLSALSFLLRREIRKQIFFYWAPVFLVILASLLALNTYIHGHPLGLRYILTMGNPVTVALSRSDIIYDLLFGKERGYFFQSSYLALIIFFSIFVAIYKRWYKDILSLELLYLGVSILSIFLILATAPNHGDHISPRYLFGTYPLLFALGLILVESFLDFKKSAVYYGVLILVVISLLFSVKQWFYAIRFIRTSDKNVRTMMDYFRSENKKYLVFTDTNIPKNIQSLMYEKTILYVSEKKLVSDFLAKDVFKIDPSQILIVRLLTTALPVDEKGCISGSRFCKLESSLPYVEVYSFR